MVNPNRFYTYAYLREDRTPYYIGKGSRNRISENKGRPCSKPKDKSRIIFLKQNLTEEEAFKHEIYMIAVFGRKDLGTGILHNKTNGGDGCSGLVHSKETKKIMSQAKKGKSQSEESNKKRSEARKGIKLSKETRKKQSESKKKLKIIPPSQKGKKWWNDGCGNNKRSVECPGEGWVPGMGEEIRKNQSEAKKGKSNSNLGRKWWNDGCGNNKRSVECPGDRWFPGQIKKIRTNAL